MANRKEVSINITHHVQNSYGNLQNWKYTIYLYIHIYIYRAISLSDKFVALDIMRDSCDNYDKLFVHNLAADSDVCECMSAGANE